MKPFAMRRARQTIVVLAAIASGTTADARAPSKLQAATSLAPMLERVLPGVVSILNTGEKMRPVTIGAANPADADRKSVV